MEKLKVNTSGKTITPESVMVTLEGLNRTLRVTKNPYSLVWAKITNKRIKATFSNGSRFEVTWSQFRFLRDNYELVKKYNVEQVDDITIKIHVGNSQIVGPPELLLIVDEIESGIYNYVVKSKVVLDIGGYKGETAVFFWESGAKKVIIYEPVTEHKDMIQENIRLNNIAAEIHFEGIGDADGEISICYEKTDNCFGIADKNAPNKKTIKIRNITTVITESGADVIKVDCEGAEISLVNVPKEILRKVEYFMIEVHSPEIRKALVKKFTSSGFSLTYGKEQFEEKVSMVHFKRD